MIPQEKIEQAAYNEFYKLRHGEPDNSYLHGFDKGVRFAESELSKPKVLEIDFAGNVKAKFEVNNGEINIIAAVDGWGHAIDPDQVIITQIEQ